MLRRADTIAEWMDMFIKLHSQFNLTEEQINQLFSSIFLQGEVGKLLKSVGNRIMTVGIYGELSAYLHLSKLKDGEGKFSVMKKSSGAATAIDLFWEHPDGPTEGIEYYTVKSDKHIDEPFVFDVTDDEAYDLYREDVSRLYGQTDVARDRMRAVDRLREFARDAKDRNPNARCYYVQVPSIVRKDTI